MNRVPTKVMAKTPYELWVGKKPSIKHLHVWGCPTDARPYNPNQKRLDSRTVSCYFVGYFEKSRDFKFFDPTIRSFFKTSNARFLEEVVSLPTVAIDDNQELILDIVQEANPKQDIVDLLPI